MANAMAEYKVSFPDGTEYKVTAPEGASQGEVIRIARQSRLPNRTEGFGIPAIDYQLSGLNEFTTGAIEGLSNMTSFISDPIIESGLNLIKPGLGTQGRQAAEQFRGEELDRLSRATAVYPSSGVRTTGNIASSFLVPSLGGTRFLQQAPTFAQRAFPVVERGLQGAVGATSVKSENMSAGESALLGGALNVVLPPAMAALISTRPVKYALNKLGQVTAPIISLIDRGAESVRGALGIGQKEAVDWASAATQIPDDFQNAIGNFIASRGKNLTGDELKTFFDDLASKMGLRLTVTPDEANRFAKAAQSGVGYGGVKKPLTESIPPVQENLGIEAAQRLRNFQRIGVTAPTTGMVTREPSAWQYERNTMGQQNLGEPIRDAIIKVNQDINDAAQNLISKIGVADDVEKVGAEAAAVLKQKEKDMQEVVGRLYRNAREQYGEKSAGPVTNFLDRLNDPNLVDDVAMEPFLTSINNRLARFGMTGDSGLVRKDAVMTVGQAEEMRKFIGQLGNGADPNVRRIRSILIDALDDDVVAGFGDDAFKVARDAAKQRFAEFKNTLAGKIAEGAIKPEQLTNRIIGGNVSLQDIRSLKNTLLTGDPQQIARGQEAWSSIGAQAVQDLFSKAKIGDNIISGLGLRRTFNDNFYKFKELLTREEFVTLNRIVKAAGDATIPVDFANVNTSNTASAIANLFAKPGENGRGVIQSMIAHLFAGLGGGPAANMAVAGAGAVTQRAATAEAERLAAQQAALAVSPVSVAEALAAGRVPQTPRPQVQGLSVPGIFPGIMNYGQDNTEYQGAWVFNPQTGKMEWVSMSGDELRQFRNQ